MGFYGVIWGYLELDRVIWGQGCFKPVDDFKNQDTRPCRKLRVICQTSKLVT